MKHLIEEFMKSLPRDTSTAQTLPVGMAIVNIPRCSSTAVALRAQLQCESQISSSNDIVNHGDEFVWVRSHEPTGQPTKKTLSALRTMQAILDINLTTKVTIKTAAFFPETWFLLKEVTLVHKRNPSNNNSFLLESIEDASNFLVRLPFKYFISLEDDADVEVLEDADTDADIEVVDEN